MDKSPLNVDGNWNLGMRLCFCCVHFSVQLCNMRIDNSASCDARSGSTCGCRTGPDGVGLAALLGVHGGGRLFGHDRQGPDDSCR
jgi:hypothetical protein